MDITLAIGVIGSACILFAFTMNQINHWKDDDTVYDGMNFVGALLLFIYALLLKSYPFMVLNGVWGVVSLRDLVADIQRDFFEKIQRLRKKHPFHKIKG